MNRNAPSSKPRRVMNKPSIMSVVDEHVRLRKSEKEYVGLCRFHSEATPSFYVNDAKGFYHCFGCQESGDAIDFVYAHRRVVIFSKHAERLALMLAAKNCCGA